MAWALGFAALLLALSLVTAIWPPPRRLTLKADWVPCKLAAQSQEELRRDIVIACAGRRKKVGSGDIAAEYRRHHLRPGKAACFLAMLTGRLGEITLGLPGLIFAVLAPLKCAEGSGYSKVFDIV
jgi:hypothetical protein